MINPDSTSFNQELPKSANLPPGSNVKVHMSVDPNWNTYPHLPGGPGMMFIWRISDNERQGQILPTKYLIFDPVNNLDYYEADPPNGQSTFGLSFLTGNNNPFQMITLILTEIVSSPENLPSSSSELLFRGCCCYAEHNLFNDKISDLS